MFRKNSIRYTTTRRFCFFALVISIIYSAAIVLVAFVVEDEVIDNLLSKEQNHLQLYVKMHQAIPKPNLDFVSYHLTLDSVNAALPSGVQVTSVQEEVFVPGPKHYHFRQISVESDSITTIYLLAEVGELLSVSKMSTEISLLFVTVLILGLCLAIWQAYILARNTTNPITKLTQKVKEMTGNSASKSITIANNANEVAYLSAIIDAVFANLEKALARESRFTQDVSHELRTPLTIFSNTLALIEQRDWQSGDLSALTYATEKMQTTIDTLLLMARDEALALDTVKIRPLIESSLVNHYTSLEAADIELSMLVSDDAVLTVNSSLFSLVVQNLLGNVVRHAPGEKLTIAMNNGQLSFCNSIDNSASSEQHDLPMPNKSESHAGLGLLLIKRMATHMSWTVEVNHTNDTFEVIFHS